MKKRLLLSCVVVALLMICPIQGQTSKNSQIECQVLEVSGSYLGADKDLSRIHYAIIHHKNAADRQRMSAILKSSSGTDVVFTRADGVAHRGALRRLRMCFGRGLLVFTESVEVKEGEVITLELQPKR